MWSSDEQNTIQKNSEIENQFEFSCINNNQPSYVCSNPVCQKHAFLCADGKCKCHISHEFCLLVEPNRLNGMMQKKLIDSKQLFVQVNKMADECIDWISEWRDKLQIDLKYYGLTKQQRNYIQCMHQKNFTNIKGSTVYPIIQNLTIKHEIIQVEQAIKIVQDQWKQSFTKINSFFTSISSALSSNSSDYFSQHINSKVITDKKQQKIIKSFFQNKKIKSFQLLYRASQNQFSVDKFFQKCSNIKNTLIVIHTGYNKKIGGFTPVEWRIKSKSEDDTPDHSRQSFIFSITNSDKFILTDPQKAIQYYGQGCGPRFGGMSGASDLTIKDKANSNNQSYSLFNNCYYNPKYKKSDSASHLLFSGGQSNFFRIQEWEVFEVKFV